MNVLIATTETQGDNDDDYSWTVDGELVYLPLFDCCAAERCGCNRGFAGLASAKATTTVMVVERPDLTEADLSMAVVDGLSRQGWIDDGWSDHNTEVLDQVCDELDHIVATFPVGSVLERTGSEIRCRGVLAA